MSSVQQSWVCVHLGIPHAHWVHEEQLQPVSGNIALAGPTQSKQALQTDWVVTESTRLPSACTATVHMGHNRTEAFQTGTSLVRLCSYLKG